MSVKTTQGSDDLQILVTELSKSNPDNHLIRKKTDVLGIPYSADIIILMSEVLVYLSKKRSKQGRLREKTA